MTSTIKLFYNSKILPERNFIVDDLEDYLSTLTSSTLSNFQYIKNGVEVEIKINLAQANLNPIEANNINYVSVLNNETNAVKHYYYVMKRSWASENTIRLSLELDSINTFKLGTHYELSNRTEILRQHKDRFILNPIKARFISKSFLTFETNKEYWLKTKGTTSEATNTLAFSGTPLANYIILKKRDISSGNLEETITCRSLLVSENSISYYDGHSTTTIDFDDLEADEVYLTLTLGSLISNYSFGSTFYKCVWGHVKENSTYLRNIDLYSEGVTPILYKTKETELSADGQSWYLVYITENAPAQEVESNAVSCYITSDKGFTAPLITSTTDYTPTTLPNTLAKYILFGADNKGATISANSQIFTIDAYHNYIFYKKDNDTLYLVIYEAPTIIADNVGKSSSAKAEYEVSSIQIQNGQALYYAEEDIHWYSSRDIIRRDWTMIDLTSSIISVSHYNKSIYELDRTRAELVKAIKLPYCPLELTSTFDNLSWEWSSTWSMYRLKNLSISFLKELTGEDNPFADLVAPSLSGSLTALRDDNNESKLFNSDFYQYKFVYDSFSFVFQIEKMTPTELTSFEYKFIPSNTINSRFLFVFSQYDCPNYATTDYNNILCVARNNEIPLYNNAYINYIRAGFNYDVKNKQRSEALSWLGAGLSVVGAVGAFASSVYTGGFGVAAGISLATTAVASITSAVNTTISAEANQNQKLTQLKQQATSVSGSDDVDLLTAYSNNKAKLCRYEVSPKVKKALADLFYYQGYISNVLDIPDFTSRKWFNFVSCNPVYKKVLFITDEEKDNLTQRLKIGVTQLHANTINSVKTWDFDQVKENWENSLNL